MNSIPDDVLLNVFSFMSSETLMRAMGVCRQWRWLPKTRQTTILFCVDVDAFPGDVQSRKCALAVLMGMIYPGAIESYHGPYLDVDYLARMTKLRFYRAWTLLPRSRYVVPKSVVMFELAHLYGAETNKGLSISITGSKKLKRFESFYIGKFPGIYIPAYTNEHATRVTLTYVGHKLDFGGFPCLQHAAVEMYYRMRLDKRDLVGLETAKTLFIRGTVFDDHAWLLQKYPNLKEIVIQPYKHNIFTRFSIKKK